MYVFSHYCHVFFCGISWDNLIKIKTIQFDDHFLILTTCLFDEDSSDIVMRNQVPITIGVNQGFCFSCQESLSVLILSYSLRAAEVKKRDKITCGNPPCKLLGQQSETYLGQIKAALNDQPKRLESHFIFKNHAGPLLFFCCNTTLSAILNNTRYFQII